MTEWNVRKKMSWNLPKFIVIVGSVLFCSCFTVQIGHLRNVYISPYLQSCTKWLIKKHFWTNSVVCLRLFTCDCAFFFLFLVGENIQWFNFREKNEKMSFQSDSRHRNSKIIHMSLGGKVFWTYWKGSQTLSWVSKKLCEFIYSNVPIYFF